MRYLIEEKSYIDALNAVVNKVNARKVDLDVRHIVIVPDGYTFTLEKRLFRSGGAFDLEVADFNRLYARSYESGKRVLSKQGAIMLLKKICYERIDDLVCYSRSALRTGFAVKLYDAISKLRSCALTPSDLEIVDGSPKIQDLALLYGEYLKQTADKFVDAGGRSELLCEEIKKGDFKNCHFYIALYDTISAQMKKLLSVIEENCLSLTVASVLPREGYELGGEIEALACPDSVTQYKEVAKRIHASVKDGANYGEWVVVDETDGGAIVKRIFEEYSIPYYTGEKLALSKSELCRFIFQTIEAGDKRYRTDDMLALCANYYSGIDKADCDAFTRFVKTRSIDYKGFTQTFVKDGEDNSLVESVRLKLLSLIDGIYGGIKGANALGNALLALLEKVDAKKKTEELSALDGRDLTQIYDKTVVLIETIKGIFGEKGDFEQIVDALKEGFEGTELSLVPSRPDTVQVGKLSAFRGREIKYCAVVNFNDGILPAVSYDDGLLQDADADKLERYRITVQPKVEQKNALCRDELWHFLSASKNIFITRVDADGMKPSFDLRLLLQKNNIEEKSVNILKELRNRENDGVRIARFLGSKAGALEAVLLDLDYPEAITTLNAIGVGEEVLYRGEERFEKIKLTKPLFFRDGKTSVSAVQTYFDCPYRYFLAYGLKIKKRDDGEVTPIDIGLLLHKLVEIYIEKGLPADTDAFVEENIAFALEKMEKYAYAVNERMLSRVKEEAKQLCVIVKRQVDGGDFTPFGSEISFGKENSTIKTITLASGISLMGEIDRVDTHGDYARVIDYKTGAIKFDFGDLYFGKKIQLLIYERVMIENGFRPAGAFYFPFAVSWSDDEFTHRLTGVFDSSLDNIVAMDRTVAQGGKSVVIDVSVRINPTTGKVDFYRSQKPRTEDEMRALSRYATLVADEAVKSVREGKFYAMPSGDGRRKACDYCDYQAVCGKEKRARETKGAGANDILNAVKEID